MLAGISTACFYPGNTEDALKDLCSVPAECTEIFLNCEYETSPVFCRELKAIADASGTRILAVHPYTTPLEHILFFSGYDRRFNEGRDYYRRLYGAAALLGAGIVVFHGGLYGRIADYGMYFDRLGVLLEDARAEGLELCHENVSYCAGRTPEFFEALIKTHPGAGVVFDTKQALRSGHAPSEFIKTFQRSVRHIHISDHKGAQDCLVPGTGVFNIREFLRAMGETGFSGGVVVELYRENFADIVELSQGYQHISAIISTLK